MSNLSKITKYLEKQKYYWLDIYNTKYDNDDIIPIELLANSTPAESDIFQIDSLINMQYLLFNFSITTKFNISYIYIPAFYVGIEDFCLFLDSVVLSKEKDIITHCAEGEGYASYLYVEILENNKIRFVHFTESLYGFKYNALKNAYEHIKVYSSTKDEPCDEPWVIRQDIIIDKVIFVKTFYKELLLSMNALDKPYEEYQEDFDKFLTRDFSIIKEFLNKYNERYSN